MVSFLFGSPGSMKCQTSLMHSTSSLFVTFKPLITQIAAITILHRIFSQCESTVPVFGTFIHHPAYQYIHYICVTIYYNNTNTGIFPYIKFNEHFMFPARLPPPPPPPAPPILLFLLSFSNICASDAKYIIISDNN